MNESQSSHENQFEDNNSVASGRTPVKQPASDLARGAHSYLEGVRFLLSTPRLWPFVVIPFAITCMLVLFAGVALVSYSGEIKDSIAPWLPVWASAIILILLVVTGAFFGFTAIGSIVSAPFNDHLSSQVELAYLGKPMELPSGVGVMVWEAIRSMAQAALRAGIYLLQLGACFLLSFIPVLGPPLFAFLTVMISIRILAWDGLDYCLSRRQYDFSQKLVYMKERRPLTMGYGAVALLALMFPFTMLFVLPINSVCGSVLFCKMLLAEKNPDKEQ